MTIKHGVASAPIIHVQCITADCPQPTDTRIGLPMVAPSVVGRPELWCVGCDQPLAEVGD